MAIHTGKVVGGAIVLDDDGKLEEGMTVAIWVGDPDEPVRVSDDEIELIREGQAAARRGELLDARAFMRELRRQS